MDCTAKCRLNRHADVVLSAVTRESLQNFQQFAKYFCGNGIKTRDSFGRNALHIAASCGRKDILKWLLEDGSLDVTEKDFESGWTALHRSCYYGHLSCALLLLEYGSNIYEKDFEGLSPIELLMFDCPRLCSRQSGGKPQLHVSSWGRNSNFTLGHGDDKERHTPEVVDVFMRIINISIKQVVICKFHTTFLAENGSVWTCGHGLGGRLGHADEKTILVPTRIKALSSQICTSIAAGQDHSVVLCENGNLFTFGLNKYHQMGHHPPASQYLSPKQVQSKAFKGKEFIGVAAGTFHTLVYTKNEVFSWGLNSGQLGHIKGDKTKVNPQQISGLHFKDPSIISAVNCCDTATVCLTNQGDVYLIYQFTMRKIISKLPNIKKVVVTGGCFNDGLMKDLKCSPLTIYGLYGDGYVFQWRESDKMIRDCHWTVQKPLVIQDIACGRTLHIVTEYGEVYTEDGMTGSVRKPTKISSRNKNIVKTCHVLKQDEIIVIPLIRVPHAHRAVQIISDKSSQNFAILQMNPSYQCSTLPNISPPEMNKHLKSLFENSENYNVEIKVKDKSILAHQVILAEGSEKLRTLINDAKQESSDSKDNQQTLLIYLDEEDFEIVREMIEFLYTRCCGLQPALIREDLDDDLAEKELFHQFNQLAFNLQDVDFDVLDTVFSESREVTKGTSSTRLRKIRRNHENKHESGYPGIELISEQLFARRKEFSRIARKYQVNGLQTRIQASSNDKKKKQKRFHRSNLYEYSDVVIESEDEVEFPCHKCILVSRLEYFSVMLTTGWIESSGDFVFLKMPIQSKFLEVIIEFLYTDDAPTVYGSNDLEFLGNILIISDQLLIIRLKEICEATLAKLVTLKNAVEILEFSCLYNAEQLKLSCLEFICMNISCLFEARSLELLSEEIIDEVSNLYRQWTPRVSWRLITPDDIHLSVPWPQPESPSKRKISRSQRRSRSSESDVIDECAVKGNESETSKLPDEKVEMDEKLPEDGQKDESAVVLENTSKHIKSSSDIMTSEGDKPDRTTAGLWYHKLKDDCSKMIMPSISSKKDFKESLSSRAQKNPTEKMPWGNSSVSPKSSNLRTIMEQEKSKSKINFDKSRKDGKSPGKAKLSQKERKKMRKSTEDDSTVNEAEDDDNEVISTSPVNPWNTLASHSNVSFRQLLKEEERLKTSAAVACGSRNNGKIAKRVAEEKSCTRNAWQHNNVACSPPSHSYVKFDKIQEIQEQETANREWDMKKPLSLIQIEDKAMAQLLEYYGGRYNPCEYIVVKRETRKTSKPDWVK
ncbi:inhibitor of Bruton tyrosine kinase-like [Dendronephthya gigantea]|uniref:inhibitor of Bruton tyrosine kinase-like n=1 Tax=Dendronephthya gigantea TaxID=151771 RepID=UPI00106B877C|nr:inhibitor of Bruton tyrosine kinase-like [Dendronephthya gigantea]